MFATLEAWAINVPHSSLSARTLGAMHWGHQRLQGAEPGSLNNSVDSPHPLPFVMPVSDKLSLEPFRLGVICYKQSDFLSTVNTLCDKMWPACSAGFAFASMILVMGSRLCSCSQPTLGRVSMSPGGGSCAFSCSEEGKEHYQKEYSPQI